MENLHMENLIDLKAYSVVDVLDKLLQDKSTKRNIIFATDAYKSDRLDAGKTTEITSALFYGLDTLSIEPCFLKSQQEQAERTKKKAEVFTPAWICNRMNNHCDEEWFGRKDVFNKEVDTEDGKHTWFVTEGKIEFPKKKRWQRYVYPDSKELFGQAADLSDGIIIVTKKKDKETMVQLFVGMSYVQRR